MSIKKIPVSNPLFLGNELKYVTESVKSSWVRTGKYLDEFENKFAKFCNVSYGASTSSGTTALHLMLLGLKFKKGDEIIVPDMTYVASLNAITYVGAKPVLVDVDRTTWNMSVDKIERKINKNTKAIMVIHLYGHPADMDKINKIAKKHKLIVLEDACQAHGALYKGKKIGSLSKAAAFSFSGAKIITTGEGGMVVTNDKSLAKRMRDLNTDFMSDERKFYHTDIGYNFRLTNLQAALGLAQFENINLLLSKKRKNAALYTKLLKNTPYVQLPPNEPWASSVFWLYSIVLKKNGLRDKLEVYLKNKGIETRPFFVPMHVLPMYKEKGDFANSDFLAKNGISLPSGTNLTKEEIGYVSSEINTFIKKNA